MSREKFELINPHAAGIDIGSEEHWVCVPAQTDKENVRRFGCFTPDLQALADWLEARGIETVAMESTGVYWIPLYQILEARGLSVFLVNAHHVKTVPGRKSDVLDCQWLQKLHSYGLLSASFRPEAEVCALRSYIRQRDTLIKSATTHVQRMQKALTQMNLQLHKVISDITGVTGLAIMKAMLAGEQDPEKLAALKDPRVKSSISEITKALTGDYRREHLFVLQQELTLYEIYQQQIAECDRHIEACLADFEDKGQGEPPPRRSRGRKKRGNAPEFDLRKHLYRISGVDFTQIDGLDVLSVQTILSEVGLDPTRFPSVKHFCAWLGLCPGSRISGGKSKSAQTRPGVNRAAVAFRIAASTLSRSQSALGAFYRRLRSRLGAPKAITATAHKLARMFYQMWTHQEIYRDPGASYYEQRYQQRVVQRLEKQASALGFELVARPSPPVAPEGVS